MIELSQIPRGNQRAVGVLGDDVVFILDRFKLPQKVACNVAIFILAMCCPDALTTQARAIADGDDE